MDIKFDKDSDDSPQVAGDNKGKQNVFLVLLLVLIGGFAYIYFFTGLIKPMPEQKVAETPVVSQVTKKPLPSPEGVPLKLGAVEAKKDSAGSALKPSTISTTPATPLPMQAAATKPVVNETAKAKENLKATGETSPIAKKTLSVSAKPGAGKSEPAEKKSPVVENKSLTTKNVGKKPAELKKQIVKQNAPVTNLAMVEKGQQKPVKKAADISGSSSGPGSWTVLIGNYVLEEAMVSDLARVRKAGLDAYIVPGAKKISHMNRLFLAEFKDRNSAQAELAKLKHFTADAFVIDSAGMNAVYAGSYLLESRAASEKQRLAEAGFNLTVKRVDVPIPTKNLTAGSFTEKNSANDVLKKLRASNIKATISNQ